MKNVPLISHCAIACAAAIALIGCSSSEMTQAESDALKNPPKTIPPQAMEGMAKQGELMKKQMEANKAAGVDSRGVPINKSNESAPSPVGG